MKYHLRTTAKFKRAYKKMQRRGLKKEDLEAVVDKLRHGEKLGIRHKDHALVGEYDGYRECHIKPDWLLVYYVDDNVLVLTLVDTGTHADLFGM